tara:strand:- start:256 stop:447 length:192 start_codon:yes stop_codon:yes gene_type:complete
MLISLGISNFEEFIVAKPSNEVWSKNFTLTKASVSLESPLKEISLPFRVSSQLISIFETRYLP